MNKSIMRVGCLLAVVTLSVSALSGCKKEEPKTPGQKLGEAVDKGIQKSGETAEKAGQELEKAGQKAQESTEKK